MVLKSVQGLLILTNLQRVLSSRLLQLVLNTTLLRVYEAAIARIAGKFVYSIEKLSVKFALKKYLKLNSDLLKFHSTCGDYALWNNPVRFQQSDLRDLYEAVFSCHQELFTDFSKLFWECFCCYNNKNKSNAVVKFFRYAFEYEHSKQFFFQL